MNKSLAREELIECMPVFYQASLIRNYLILAIKTKLDIGQIFEWKEIALKLSFHCYRSVPGQQAVIFYLRWVFFYF